MSDDKFKVTYQFISTMKNSGMEEHPDRIIEINLDGTDVNLRFVVGQVETFLKAAGYFFDHLEIVK